MVIGCGKQKQSSPAAALDLYTSTHAWLAAAWARSVTTPDKILVLSAKYGLIDSRTLIEPYDVSFRSARAFIAGEQVSEDPVDPDTLGRQIAEFGLSGPVAVLAGLLYRSRLAAASGGDVEPFHPFVDHLRAIGTPVRIGTLMSAMKQHSGRLPSAGRSSRSN